MNNDSIGSNSDSTAPQQTRRENSPDHSIRADGPVGQGGDANATIHDRTGLYLAIIAMVLSALCLGLFLMQTFLMPQIIDAKVQAGIADARAAMQQQVADATAVAQAGKEHARIALDEVQRANAQLEAKGLIRGSH
jgi:cobalamin biosynthesis protein CobD/CbiB